MKRHFDDDLQAFHSNLLKMANMTERSINAALDALHSRDAARAQKAIRGDNRIDTMELIIEEQGIDLLALHQPMASDLRMITTGLKINSELERIADLGVNICQRVIEIVEQPILKPLIDIPLLAEQAKSMVRQAIDSFVNKDEELAKKVILMDNEADRLKKVIQSDLLNDYIVKDGSTAPRAVPLILVARDLERICDHATYIAEDVIFMIDATVVKHHRDRLLTKAVEQND
ncbi:MAG: phosphate signaling complex protein PhoU [Candidatus Omnitrophica bacterium]|nr:phosphate signaling complex protein PhoU [Candidatus Omnitrophota bacterium]